MKFQQSEFKSVLRNYKIEHQRNLKFTKKLTSTHKVEIALKRFAKLQMNENLSQTNN